MSGSSDLLVLGGGPAGIAAAWRAAQRGLSVTLVERGNELGGLAASFEVAGVRVDHGSHRLHPATAPHLLADLRALMGSDLQTRARDGRLRVADSWVGFPLRPGELMRALPPRMLAGIAADSLTAPLAGLFRRTNPSFAGVLRGGLGPTLYDALYAPYAVKLWGLAGDAIDADQATKRVTADTPWKVAARMLGLGQRRTTGQGRIFHYPRRGFGQLVDALAHAATDAGAYVRLGAEVTSVTAGNDQVVIRTASGQTLSAAHVFSTLPMPVFARLVSTGAPTEVLDDASRLRFRAMVLVYVVHQGGRWTRYDAHYLPAPQTPVTRISEPANYRESADDPRDLSVLCVEVPCAVGDSVWSASDEQLGALVEQTLEVTALPPCKRVAVQVRRLAHVYPIYEIGYAQHLAALDRWVGQLPRVTSFGRLGLFAHDNTHHALAMAYDAVDALVGDGMFDRVAWAAARKRFAAHVVED